MTRRGPRWKPDGRRRALDVVPADLDPVGAVDRAPQHLDQACIRSGLSEQIDRWTVDEVVPVVGGFLFELTDQEVEFVLRDLADRLPRIRVDEANRARAVRRGSRAMFR